ncbi:MAG: family 20 glycosylhydrolase [Clostridia bacterium]|nr:family 20 glycosylhydrolase [Clostridia bacterium]
MISYNEFEYIKQTVFKILKFNKEIKFSLCEKDGVYVSYKKDEATIGATSKTFVARALMLTALNVSKGNLEFEISQKPSFDKCGAMLDVSSGSILTIEKTKEYISYMAAFGLNTFYFYIEDMYELEGYPQFGYMRGRFSVSQLQELDSFADSLGVEVIPCIQTLAHMQHYLRWREAGPVTDMPDTLLCGSEDTYRLIDKMAETMRKAFKTKRINVGLDETFNLGKGQYEKKFGKEDATSIFEKHLRRVVEICNKYDFQPQMWSDMLFVMRSKNGQYNDTDLDFGDEMSSYLPDVDLTYWEYLVTDEDTYDKMLKKHKSFGKKVVFAGSVWTFLQFLPSYGVTFDATIPALKACIKNDIKEVFATLWGGDGAECPMFMSIAGLAIYSEYCYRSLDCTLDDIKEVMEFVGEMSYDFAMLISKYDNLTGKKNQGRNIFYGDIFWGPLGKDFDYKDASKLYGDVLDSLKIVKSTNEDYNKLAKLLFEILKIKTPLFYIRNPYNNKDIPALKNALADVERLKVLYKDLWTFHKLLWDKYCKIFGWEIHSSRYASILARLDYIADVLTKYIIGEIDAIEELEETLEDAVSAVPLPIYNRLRFTPFPVL